MIREGKGRVCFVNAVLATSHVFLLNFLSSSAACIQFSGCFCFLATQPLSLHLFTLFFFSLRNFLKLFRPRLSHIDCVAAFLSFLARLLTRASWLRPPPTARSCYQASENCSIIWVYNIKHTYMGSEVFHLHCQCMVMGTDLPGPLLI